MRAAVAVLVAVAIVFVLADPPRPQLKEQFETQFTIHLVDGSTTIFGQGLWAVNTPKGHASERLTYSAEHKHRNIHIITRYDNTTQYVVTHEQGAGDKCTKSPLTPPMAPTWGWVAESKYAGKKKIGQVTYDTWSYIIADTANLLLAVNETNPNVPSFFEQKHGQEHMELHFHRYHEREPHPREFDVPQVCTKPE